MEYEWNEAKRQSNIEKHGWDFAEAKKALEGPAPVKEEYSERKGEDRWTATGKIDQKTVVVVYEDKGEAKRIISMRDATYKERTSYEKEQTRELGKEDRLTQTLEKTKMDRERNLIQPREERSIDTFSEKKIQDRDRMNDSRER